MFDHKEEIARYNNYAAINTMIGMAYEKQKALEHPYPSIIDKINKYGCDFKQYSHALRMREMLKRYIDGELYEDILISNMPHTLIAIKENCCTLQEARDGMEQCVKEMQNIRDKYVNTHPLTINANAKFIMNKTVSSIIKQQFREELKA